MMKPSSVLSNFSSSTWYPLLFKDSLNLESKLFEASLERSILRRSESSAIINSLILLSAGAAEEFKGIAQITEKKTAGVIKMRGIL
jgi:hypothetical protein